MKPTEEQLQQMLDTSFRNFHQKGFDYLCLKRDPAGQTIKVYFFDDNIRLGTDLVSPHDHRYVFHTRVLAGAISNSFYEEDVYGDVYNEFLWRTPLLGGNGHEWSKETRLLETERRVMRAGEEYTMQVHQLHTIRVHRPGTVIELTCEPSVVPRHLPTRTFIHDREAPKLNGLYDRFTADALLARLKQYGDLYSKGLTS